MSCHHALDLAIDSSNNCSRQFYLGFNSLQADSVSSKAVVFLSFWEAQNAQELALIHEDSTGMEKRGNACRVALTNGRWTIMDEFFSQLILGRKMLRNILQTGGDPRWDKVPVSDLDNRHL